MLKAMPGFFCMLALAGTVSAAQAPGGSVTRYLVTRYASESHLEKSQDEFFMDPGAPAAKMMGPEELAEFFTAGAGLIAPLGQYIHAYEKDLSCFTQ